MIIFDIECENTHRFEGWFKSSDEFNNQIAAGMITCPICGSSQVHKLPTASRLNITRSSTTDSANSSASADNEMSARKIFRQLQDYVTKNYEDVGDKFAEEATRIHYGECEKRNIRGKATQEEVSTLHDEGIDVMPLPVMIEKEKLN